MYDSATEKLISDAHPLSGLDLAELPRQLTDAYAAIVELRVRLATQAPNEFAELDKKLAWLKRLASTYEAMACLLNPGSQQQKACAFVAATAHHLIYRVGGLGPPSAPTPVEPEITTSESARQHLTAHSISSELASLLLFFIAGALPDALEVAKEITPSASPTPDNLLLRAILLLAHGNLEDISTLSAQAQELSDEDPVDIAISALWERLLVGVVTLGSELLDATVESKAEEIFYEVKALSSERVLLPDIKLPFFTEETHPSQTGLPEIYSIFGGPHHTATLLLLASKALLNFAVSRTPPPDGLIPSQWESFLRSLAKQRPYLWPNHIDAIQKGLLGTGTSSVISFPTGAGKSTLIQLKVASAIFQGKSALILAPTHALIEQFISDFKKIFPEVSIRTALRAARIEQSPIDEPSVEITIMTPERCLTQFGVDPTVLNEIGLIVFDECHLIHPTQDTKDRRSLDAMLCLLNLLGTTPQADFVLISAMMANAPEIANWIAERINKTCIPLDLAWKPTRQARGCVVFETKQISELRRRIRESQQHSKTTGPPKSLQREMTALPYGLFCLRQSWTSASSDYALRQLLDSQVPLSVSATPKDRGGRWYLTANRNQVAASVAAGFANAKIRTMVLVQVPGHASSLGISAAKLLENQSSVILTEAEQALADSAALELGGSEFVDGLILPRAATHHGLLLPFERRLSERLFSRDDGVDVLVVSPTLAMGINLPAEAVIIAGDDRYEADLGATRPLTAHELLNAAGRAGRAGSGSHGIVLVIPGKVISIDNEKHEITSRWLELQENVFSKGDQCLTINDPLELWLDILQLQTKSQALDQDARYFLTRLPGDPSTDTTAKFFRTSLSAFRAKQANRIPQYEKKLQHMLALRSDIIPQRPDDWRSEVSFSSGIPTEIIDSIDRELRNIKVGQLASVIDWLRWWLMWLQGDSSRAYSFVDEYTLKKTLPKLLKQSAGFSVEQSPLALVAPVIENWMNGKPLKDIEIQLGTPSTSLDKCNKARELVIRVIPNIGYGLGVVAQVRQMQLKETASMEVESALASASGCIREGFDGPEKLALHYITEEEFPRRFVHDLHGKLGPLIPSGTSSEDFQETRRRIAAAYRLWME